MASEGVRHAVITSDDHGALLTMTAWFLSCALVLFIAARLTVRFTTQHIPGVDDIIIVFAGAFAIGSTIAISFAVNSGLGKKSHLLDKSKAGAIQKDMYAATILYILTIGLSKFSITTFFSRLTCTTLHKVVVVILSAVIVCWTIATTLGVLFQCELPHPWEVFTGKCIPLLPYWVSVGVIDILTDLVMIILPIHIIWDLQMAPSKKSVVMFIFAIRSVLIAISILRLVYLTKFITADPAFDSIPYGILTQCHSTLSVIVACSPALKPFMDSVRTGMLSASLAKHTPGTTWGHDNYNMQPLSHDSKDDSGNGSSKRRSKSTMTRVSPTPEPKPKPTPAQHFRSESGTHVLVTNAFGRIVKHPLMAVETIPTFTAAEAVPNCPLTAPSRSRASRSPPRPPPPPEELRPDLSMFTAKARSGSPASRHGRGNSARLDRVYTRYSEDSEESDARIIKKTRPWDVRYDDYHDGVPRAGPSIEGGRAWS
ncbi:hypothetical protein BCR34DRAFT_97286 [Clohesyomyces aquaticus]|uniref:Rhodopsin domain-containing protein n=1 Tax=Clohesyomyces aquaticus TaxID=1231657 RepID=A0A1Y2A3Q5_9PLEO|nr:hypothetical protein BCR34DRAFT_97286 [Clohesyomyces aquaticus]